MGLVETWVDEDRWKKIKDRVPNNYVWNCVPARREHIKGRAKGGIIIAVSRRLKDIKG